MKLISTLLQAFETSQLGAQNPAILAQQYQPLNSKSKTSTSTAGTGGLFQQFLNPVATLSPPTPPTNPNDPAQLAAYNQSLITYINQLQTNNTLQMQQMVLRFQQLQTQQTQTAATSSTATAGASTTPLVGSTVSQSLLL